VSRGMPSLPLPPPPPPLLRLLLPLLLAKAFFPRTAGLLAHSGSGWVLLGAVRSNRHQSEGRAWGGYGGDPQWP
jgi:hypothetical protein